jgi:hypothetical protein
MVTKFGQTEAQAGEQAAKFAFYDDFVLLAMTPVSAILMDVWHRKAITVLAFLGMGGVMIGISFVTTLFPGFMTFNMFFGVCFVPMVNSPFFSDYVAVEAMGPAVSFIFVFHILGDLVSSFACVWIHGLGVQVDTLFFAMGCSQVFGAGLMLILLKEMPRK